MSVYPRLKKTADRLINRYGKPVQLVAITTTGPSYDPQTTAEKRDAVMVEIGYKLARIDGSTIQAGDRVGLMRSEDAPALADKLVIDSREYSFVDVQPLEPGPLNILYEVHARG